MLETLSRERDKITAGQDEITMSATLKLTHKTIGVEVRRGPYDVVVDGRPAGSVALNESVEIPVEPGRISRRRPPAPAADGAPPRSPRRRPPPPPRPQARPRG